MVDVKPRPSSTEPSRTHVAFDLEFPPIPFPSPAIFAAVGSATLRALVERHHERLRESSIGNLFPAERKHFASVVRRIADFVVEATAGAPQATPARGQTWLRALHFPIAIDETARNVWLAMLLLAFDDIEFPAEARREYWNWVEALSIIIINRRTMISQPQRYPFADARIALRPFMGTSQSA